MKKKIAGLKVRYNSISYKDKVIALQNEIKTEKEEIQKLDAQNVNLHYKIKNG